MSESMEEEADKWYYDLGKLAQIVESNSKRSLVAQRKSEVAQKRLLVLAAFVLFSFLALAYRSEVNSDRIAASSERITKTQNASCLSGLEILRKFNKQQDILVEIERQSTGITEATRAARIKAYQDVRIDPLPVCEEQ